MGPVGSAGEPEDREAYVDFSAGDVTVYLAREIWKQALEDGGRLSVLMPGYGKASFWFEGQRSSSLDNQEA